MVYKVVNEDPNLLFNDFYFATFDDTSSEEVVGVGYDIESAPKGSCRKNLVGLVYSRIIKEVAERTWWG
ncbi:hypothetical protein CF87_gp02 [Sulfolobus monocaudavirus SMV1]|uniref:hypothetical protein n=1 Tax=Sulfolobus monocaudavirus SMV1 TaxID=1351702 RepID=UPI0003D9096A|nr:hypothetical protein CF87_gp02 [Sulfolobus monocaudavirus SMV1]CDF81329.1 hypothetical protein [Sulfolobus monocaudavirus SMV1]